MEKWQKSLKTDTPEEGFELAIKLAQEGVKRVQPNEKIREKLRPKYSKNADSITFASQVIAIHFQTVAAANNYWTSKVNYIR
ncbi:MAG TPA: hexameric tyrosine-coordinated heme protein [Virgibacillus sp.]|nr:hexameric tyrosine-coordinated heme protein [Virgibacillus sp.]